MGIYEDTNSGYYMPDDPAGLPAQGKADSPYAIEGPSPYVPQPAPRAPRKVTSRATGWGGHEASGAHRKPAKAAVPVAKAAVPVAKAVTPSASSGSPKAQRKKSPVKSLLMTIILAIFILGALDTCDEPLSISSGDRPGNDSPEAAAFIEDPTVTEADLETFDALSGSIGSVGDKLREQARYSGGDSLSSDAPPSAEELRAQLEREGRWPQELPGYGGIDSQTSPQLWVRIAELSRMYIVKETGEEWQVFDFDYPQLDESGIFPEGRERYHHATCRLVCVDGKDAGLYAEVEYYRWRDPAEFESNYTWRMTKWGNSVRQSAEFAALPQIEGRRVLFDSNYAYVWANSADDPLYGRDAFITLATSLFDADACSMVALIAEDYRVQMRYSPLSYEYPNHRDPIRCSLEEAQALMDISSGAWYLDCDYDKELWMVYSYTYTEDGVLDPDEVFGMLSMDRWV